MKIRVNGLNVSIKGKKHSKAIIFVHGFPFDHTMWNFQIEELKKDFLCISYDVRGFGNSKIGDGQYTMEQYALDLIQVVDELKLEKPFICGLSMGGYICLRAIEIAEEKFGGIILMDTKSLADDDEVKIKRARAIMTINEEGAKSYVKEFIPPLFSDKTIINKKTIVERFINKYKYNDKTGMRGGQLAMISRTDTTSVLEKTSLNILLLCGEDDKLTSPDVMKEMIKNKKTTKFVLIPEAGHLAPFENPEVVNKFIKDFLIGRDEDGTLRDNDLLGKNIKIKNKHK